MKSTLRRKLKIDGVTIELGRIYRDTVFGFEGKAMGVCQYLTGCSQVELVAEDPSEVGKMCSKWLDINRIEPAKVRKVGGPQSNPKTSH